LFLLAGFFEDLFETGQDTDGIVLIGQTGVWKPLVRQVFLGVYYRGKKDDIQFSPSLLYGVLKAAGIFG
jgi:hypothetical protein